MPLSSPIGVFGIHSITPYKLSDGTPYGTMRVLGQLTITNAIDLVSLMGGSSKDAWAVELGKRDVQVTATIREIPDFLWQILAGKAITVGSPDALAGVTTLTNLLGTSVKQAATGIASAGVLTGSETDVKYNAYVVKAVSATTVDVYGLTDVDFSQGPTLQDWVDDTMKLTATPLTITMGAAVNIPGVGLKLTGGSGTIALVVGDTAYFVARPENTINNLVAVGTKDERFVPFGLMCQAQRKSDGTIFNFNFYKVMAGGIPFNMKEQAFSEWELKITPVRSVPVISLGGNTAEGLYEFHRVVEIAA